jgi:hypothetical protein
MALFTDSKCMEQLIDIEEMARIRLQHSPYRALRRVTCSFTEGTLALRGCVPTFHYKQLAQVTVAGIAGVQRIINCIEVESTLDPVDRYLAD